jgi:hypothetical protein
MEYGLEGECSEVMVCLGSELAKHHSRGWVHKSEVILKGEAVAWWQAIWNKFKYKCSSSL